MKRRAFTLIELLVVLAILALLAALIFPVFSRVREKGRQTVCASNLHQVALALKMYESDSDEHLPPYPVENLEAVRTGVWPLLMPYAHGKNVFHCPDEWGKVEKQTGYSYNMIGPYRRGDAFAPTVRSQSGKVVAFCGVHTKHLGEDAFELDAAGRFIGNYIVVREDGSTATVPGTKTEWWILRNGEWDIRPPGGGKPGDFEFLRFPDEPWPPQFER